MTTYPREYMTALYHKPTKRKWFLVKRRTRRVPSWKFLVNKQKENNDNE